MAGAEGEREELRAGRWGFSSQAKWRVLNRGGKDLSWVLTGALWWLQRVRTLQELKGQGPGHSSLDQVRDDGLDQCK